MDCKVQGYDNGANMDGKHNGVQSRILEINQQAHFVPCICHYLNSILCDRAKTNVNFFSFFGTLQKLFFKVSSSTRRWKILKDNCSLVVKYPLNTRWESRINSVKAVYTNLSGIIKTLLLILQDTSSAADFSELNGILNQLTIGLTPYSSFMCYLVQRFKPSRFCKQTHAIYFIGCGCGNIFAASLITLDSKFSRAWI